MSISIYWLIYIGIFSLAAGFGLAYTIRIRIAQKKVNQALIDEEQQLTSNIQSLKDRLHAQEQITSNNIALLENNFLQIKSSKDIELNNLETKRLALLQSIDDLNAALEQNTKSSEEAARNVQAYAMALAAENIEKQTKELQESYKAFEEKYQTEVTTLMKEAVLRYQEITANAQAESDHAQMTLQDLRNRIDVIVANNKRAAQEESQRDFYRLQLSPEDVEEIAKIRSIEPYLRSAEPLNKVIWKVYYEKAYNDLVGRVLGPVKKVGIYKITNLKNNMCYIGQSLDVAERWKQHIKRGVGADQPTRNKLYPAMVADKVENFTFELLEECPAAKLNEREDYWQDVYHAKDFGYSIK